MRAQLHPHLKAGWQTPQIPEMYNCIALSEYGFSRDLDFYNREADAFYSAEQGVMPSIEWPWSSGFDPLPPDWSAIGIVFIDYRTAFNL